MFDKKNIESELSQKTKHYCECFIVPQERLVVVNAFNVLAKEKRKIRKIIYNYEDDNYEKYGYFFSAQIITKRNTKKFFSEKLPLIKQFDSLQRLIKSLLKKEFHNSTAINRGYNPDDINQGTDDIMQGNAYPIADNKIQITTAEFKSKNTTQVDIIDEEQYALAA